MAAVVVLVAAVAFFALTGARPSGRILPDYTPDPAGGEVIYHAGNCLGCHKARPGLTDTGPPSGGVAFETPVGTFYPGNLTPDAETGLGSWSAEAFVDAMVDGVSPDGRHYLPAFPYTSFRNMRVEDLLDLRAYLMSLPAVRSPGREADVPLLGLARRATGLWKRLAFRAPVFEPDPSRSAVWNRGAYLVQGPGHCGECHTPRNLLMLPDAGRALVGGPHPSGEGRVPSLHNLVGHGQYKDAADLVLALQFGETFGYEKLSSGGMAQVQVSLAQLPEGDLAAIVEYLLSLR